MAVRTKQLASGRRVDNTLGVVYTVPADETAIVKTVRLVNLSTSTAAVVIVAMDAGAFDNTLWLEQSIGPRAYIEVLTWTVLPPGATIAVQGPGTPAVNYWISGTELEGVAD